MSLLLFVLIYFVANLKHFFCLSENVRIPIVKAWWIWYLNISRYIHIFTTLKISCIPREQIWTSSSKISRSLSMRMHWEGLILNMRMTILSFNVAQTFINTVYVLLTTPQPRTQVTGIYHLWLKITTSKRTFPAETIDASQLWTRYWVTQDSKLKCNRLVNKFIFTHLNCVELKGK